MELTAEWADKMDALPESKDVPMGRHHKLGGSTGFLESPPQVSPDSSSDMPESASRKAVYKTQPEMM